LGTRLVYEAEAVARDDEGRDLWEILSRDKTIETQPRRLHAGEKTFGPEEFFFSGVMGRELGRLPGRKRKSQKGKPIQKASRLESAKKINMHSESWGRQEQKKKPPSTRRRKSRKKRQTKEKPLRGGNRQGRGGIGAYRPPPPKGLGSLP